MQNLQLLVTFTCFNWDNYQGGSGQYVQITRRFELSGLLECGNVNNEINVLIQQYLKENRPFTQPNEYMVNKIEVL